MPEPQEVVIAGVLPDRVDRLNTALLRLDGPTHFTSAQPRALFALLSRYHEKTGAVMPRPWLAQVFGQSSVDPAKVAALELLFGSLETRKVPDDEFTFAVEQLRADASRRDTGTMLATGMEILQRGFTVDGVDLSGHDDARRFLQSKILDIDRAENVELMPAGDIFREGAEILADYEARAAGTVGRGVLSGIASIDGPSGGFQNGELVLVVAYTGQGKSQFVTQSAWDTAVKQGRDVFFATTENVRGQVIRRIIARHSREPQFETPEGINSQDIRRGSLDARGREVLAEVVNDWRHNPNYGKLHVVQMPRGGTLSLFEGMLREFGRNHDVAIAVADYLALFRSDTRRQSQREEFDELLRDAKQVATSFGAGRGIPLVSPWSVNQNAYLNALKDKNYSLASLSETSQAEKSADVIIAMLREEDDQRMARLQFLKNRDGEVPQPIEVAIDFRSSYLGDREGAAYRVGASAGAAGQDVDGFLGEQSW